MANFGKRRRAATTFGVLLLILGTAAVFFSCTTSAGNTYASVVAAESAQKSRQGTDSGRSPSSSNSSSDISTTPGSSVSSSDEDVTITTVENAPAPRTPGAAEHQPLTITVTSDPSGADVFVNGNLQGVTPVTMSGLSEGRYRVTVQKDGYYSVTRRIDATGGTTVEMAVTLRPVVGYLLVQTAPSGADVYVDGNQVYSAVTALPVGAHSVRVRLFGYQDASQYVTIYEDSTTTVNLSLQPAAFAVTDYHVSRPVFSPYNVGPVGKTRAVFSVTAPGTGTIEVTNSAGTVVQRIPLPRFTTWDQSFSWNGRSESGKVVPNGDYTMVLTAVPGDGGKAQTESASVQVDNSLRVSYESMWSGSSGLAYVPTADVLPAGGFEVVSLFAGHLDTTGTANAARFPLSAGVRFGIPGSIEANIAAHATVNSIQSLNDFGLSIFGKWRWLNEGGVDGGVQASVVAGGSFLSQLRTDSFTAFNGVGVGFPLTLRIGPVGFAVAPEIFASTNTVSYNAFDAGTPGIYMWGYGRAGVFIDTGSTFVGVSAAARTPAFAGTVSSNFMRTASFPTYGPIEVAAELHGVLPGTSIFVSILGTEEITPPAGFYASVGGGIGFLY